MKKNELKKYLYVNKLIAVFECVSKKGVLYKTEIPDRFIYFLIPLDEIGDATFSGEMESQLLIRYIVD